MSFFDEVETTVANTRFLQAVEDSGPVKLSLQPFEELGQLSTALQNEVSMPQLLKPKTMGLYLFKQFLKEPMKEKSVKTVDRLVFLAFLEAVDEFAVAKTHERAAKGKAVYDTYLKYGGFRQAAGVGTATMSLAIPEAEFDEDEGPETSQALREYEDDEEGSVHNRSERRRSRSATAVMEQKSRDSSNDLKKQDSVTGKQVDVHLHLSSGRDGSIKRVSAASSSYVSGGTGTAPPTPTAASTTIVNHTFTPTTTAAATTLPTSSTNLSPSTSINTTTSTNSDNTVTFTQTGTTATNTSENTGGLFTQGPPPPPPPPPEPSPPPSAEAGANTQTGSEPNNATDKGESMETKKEVYVGGENNINNPHTYTATTTVSSATNNTSSSSTYTQAEQTEASRVVVPEYSKSDLPPPSTPAAADTPTTAIAATTEDSFWLLTTNPATSINVTQKTPPPPPPYPSTSTTTTSTTPTTASTTPTTASATPSTTEAAVATQTSPASTNTATTAAENERTVSSTIIEPSASTSNASNTTTATTDITATHTPVTITTTTTNTVNTTNDTTVASEVKAEDSKKSESYNEPSPIVSVKIDAAPSTNETKINIEEDAKEDRPMDEMSFGSLAELVKRIDKMDSILNELVRCLGLKPPPVESFNSIIAAFARVFQVDKMLDDFIASPQWKRYVQLRAYVKKRMTLDHFRVFRVLGRGAFGAVSAVQKIDTHAIFAMKEMAKRQVKHQQSEWVCVNERKVLAKMKSPFVLNLKYSFHNSENMYLIFDMCSGGDLKFHLRNEKMRCFSLERSRFYAAEVLLGLEHIHSLNIVYRDLKPTNILLDEEGHCVISDLGLTVHLKKNKLIKHLAGTAGYWAPEILQKAGTYKTSDYWSFGVMLYEMMLGRRPSCKCSKKDPQWCPFGQSRSMEQFALKEDGVLILDVDYPRELIPDAVDLLKKLFEPNPEKRIGAVHGAAEIKAHPFFKSVDWAKLENKEITPPFKPDNHTVNANSIGEVGETNKAKYRKIKLLDEDEKHYEDFDFINMDALEAEMVTALIKMDAPPAPAKEVPKGNSNGSGCCLVS